jgi:Fis family transcriptional regulator
LKGIAQVVENEMMTTAQETKEVSSSQTLGESVRHSLRQYFAQLDGQTPANLYGLVLAEIEKPLLEMVLQLTNGNQSKAAIILGISRGTLRKKMAIYGLL